MSSSSTLDPDAIPGSAAVRPQGHDVRSLGPSDRSDTGSDSVGDTGLDPVILDGDGDSTGTGVDSSPIDPCSDDTDADIGFDRVVGESDAGLGGDLQSSQDDLEVEPGASIDDLAQEMTDTEPEGQDDPDDARSDDAIETLRPRADKGPDAR